jgi:predicted nucleic acid-binding protein
MDPSAFVKRYHDEKGTELVNELFKKLETREERFTTSVWSIAESVAVLNRIKNKVKMKEDDFAKILMAFFSEIKQFHFLEVNDERVLASISYSLTHNINSSDALHLKTLKDVEKSVNLLGEKIVLVAADKRLLRAAQNEGVATFNPEEDVEKKLDDLLEIT